MQIPRTARRTDDDGRILPLINVVFLLLIFFMVVGKLSVFDPFAVTPPTSRSEGLSDEQEMIVLVAADGRLALDGAVVDEAALKTAVAERMQTDQRTPVRLKADANAEAVRVVAVMELLRDAGVKQVSLLTLEQSP